jgi:hypothetical protein
MHGEKGEDSMELQRQGWPIAVAIIGISGAVLAQTENKKAYLDIYGHAMLDMGYQFGASDPDWYDVVRPSKLPVYAKQYGRDGNFFASVRQSRLGVKGLLPTEHGDIKTIFEFELFGVGPDAGQTTFRLRHAYGEFKQFGGGQYWSVFMDPDVFPNSIEYWGPSGMVFFRNIQARYMPLRGDNAVAISLEKPGGSGDPGVLQGDERIDDFRGRWPLPDLAAQYRRTTDWGHVQAAGILRYAELDDNGADPVDLSRDFLGWGINLSTNIKIANDTVKLQGVFGEGIGNYMNDGTVDIGALEAGDPDVAETLPLFGIVAFYDRTWNEHFTSTFGYSMIDVENSAGQTASAFDRGHYALANLLYHPTENLTCGVELQYGKRQNKGDGQIDDIDGANRLVESSDDFRVQFSVKYSFGARVGG